MFAQLLKKNKLSQKEIASTINKSQQLVSKWCCGICEPQMSDVNLICNKYNISTDEILKCFKNQTTN